jgi:hypothetical protein
MESPFLPEQQALLGADKDCRDSCEDCGGLVVMHGGKQASGRRAEQRAHGRRNIESHRQKLPAPLESDLPGN